MNATVMTDNAPVVDPLAAMDLDTPAIASAPVATSTAVAVRPELPLIVLSTITKPGSLFDISRISPAEMTEIEKLVGTVVLSDQSSAKLFGAEMQKQYSDGLSRLLGESTVGEAGLTSVIAEDLQLSTEIVQKAIEKFGEKQGGVSLFRKALRALPAGIGGHVTAVEVMIESRHRLTEIFERMEVAIAARLRAITVKNTALDILASNIKTHLLLLRRHLLAGERAVLGMYDQYRQEVIALPQNPDPMQVSDLIMKKNLIIGFEIRLTALGTAYVKAGTLLPAQLQGIKQASDIVFQNLLDTSTVTIPDMKVSALQLTALTNLQEANAQSEGIRKQAAIAAEQAQELLGQVMIGAKEQQGQVLDEAQRLKALLDKMKTLQYKAAELDEGNLAKIEEARKLNAESQAGFNEAERLTAQKFLALTAPKA